MLFLHSTSDTAPPGVLRNAARYYGNSKQIAILPATSSLWRLHVRCRSREMCDPRLQKGVDTVKTAHRRTHELHFQPHASKYRTSTATTPEIFQKLFARTPATHFTKSSEHAGQPSTFENSSELSPKFQEIKNALENRCAKLHREPTSTNTPTERGRAQHCQDREKSGH